MKGRLEQARRDQGSALLIAIFALLLISVVGIALLVSTGSDSALAGNYRNSVGAYYAAVAGLEEGRGRLLLRNPNFIGKSLPSFLPPPYGAPLAVNTVAYIINPASGESVNPTDPANAYYDKEYLAEFGGPGNVQMPLLTSVSPAPSASPALPGPSYKWVRINPVTEDALQLDVDGQGANDKTTPLYYAGTGLNRTSSGTQALEITALTIMPDKSTKLLQYIVGAVAVTPLLPNMGSGFPAALTLLGTGATFAGPNNNNFYINGQDQGTSCSSPNFMVPSIGFADSTGAAKTNIVSGAQPPSNYPGYPASGSGSPPQPSTSPNSILDVGAAMNTSWLNPKELDTIVQSITNNADVVINGNATGGTITTNAVGMSGTNPMTIVVNGDLDLNAWHNTGYGLLLVTGTLYYDPDATWEGLVLVIGQGNLVSTKHGTGGIDGAVLLAKTRDGAGNLLTALGPASYSQTGGTNSGRGINYNSCWISGQYGAQGPLTYKVLSFREITQ